jgi:hypothetical protein
MLFKEIIAVYSENHKKPTHTEYSITNCQDSWDIQLQGFKGLNTSFGWYSLRNNGSIPIFQAPTFPSFMKF